MLKRRTFLTGTGAAVVGACTSAPPKTALDKPAPAALTSAAVSARAPTPRNPLRENETPRNPLRDNETPHNPLRENETPRNPLRDNETALQRLEQKLGGRVGVFAVPLGADTQALAYRADERFALCSTFKWALAAAVLSRIDNAQLRLDQTLVFGKQDVLEWAPITRTHVGQGGMTLEALMHASITVSDNTAANLLLSQIGGPAGLSQFLREIGDTTTRLDRTEPMLNTNLPGDQRDTTSPRAMAETLRKVLTADVLSSASRERLRNWLKQTTTGLNRLRAGFPPGWDAGDKTGSGGNGAFNDVAVLTPPNAAPWFVASYLSESTQTAETLALAQAEIGRILVAHIRARP